MAQPIKNKNVQKKKSVPHKKFYKKKKHPDYGTSKLEDKFASEFLDKLGIKYTRQFKAESIGRYYDFRVEPRGPIIEIQGSYWHGDPRLYEEKDLNRTQKRDRAVDEYKKSWCLKNGIKLIYIWELDIKNSPDKVMEFLRNELKQYTKKKDGKV